VVKRPAYQWNVVDAEGDEVFQLMDYEQRGIYRTLLDRQWLEGSIPADPARVFGLLKLRSYARFKKLWPLIASKFQEDGDRLRNARLERYREEVDDYSQKRSIAGRLGGRAKAGNAKALLEHVAGNATAKPRTTTTTTTVHTVSSKQSGAAPEKTPSPARDFLVWFQDEYKRRRNGAAYFVTWDKHMPIVGRLLKLHDPQRLRKHAQILLTTDEDWTETTDRGIEVLASKINWLEERLCAWETKRRAREAV
jgi:uncharacterized protein YdaU (DUF1376 family)